MPQPTSQEQRALTTEDLHAEVLVALGENPAKLTELLAPLHYSDIADLLECLPLNERREVVKYIPQDIFGDVLSDVGEGVQEALLQEMPSARVAEAISHLDSDDVADIVQHLDEEKAEEVQEQLPEEHKELLSWPEDSAGGIMQRECVALPKDWTVEEALAYIRENGAELPENLYRVFVVGGQNRFLGSLSCSRLVKLSLKTRLSDVMNKNAHTVLPEVNQRDVAALFEKYDLYSCPVVDEKKKLIGLITIDDILDVIVEEREKGFMRAAGLEEGEDLFAPIGDTTRRRFPWLLVNLFTAISASIVIAIFEEQISQLVALAVLMPIVASMGGNAGTQTLTVTVRGLAMNQVTMKNALPLLKKELLVGGFNGIILALLVGVGTMLIYDDYMLGAVICSATIVNHIFAALAGNLIPVAIEKLGGDPAVSSGVLVTTVTDVGGFFAFLGLASWMLLS